MDTNLNTQPYGLDPTVDELADLLLLYANVPGSQVTFSCSPQGDVWPKENIGWTKPVKRQLVGGRSPLLDTVVALALHRAPEGGILDIDINGATLRRTGEMLVTFDLRDE